MIAVLGGLADVERDLIRTRTAEGRSRPRHARSAWAARRNSPTRITWRPAARRAEGATLDELAASLRSSFAYFLLRRFRTNPAYFHEKDHLEFLVSGARSRTIVRILLLHEFGGIWVDATLFCNRPLDEWLPGAMAEGFFAFAAPAPDRLLSSWFLSAVPNHYLVSTWCRRAIEYWSNRPKTEDYFWFHHLFGDMCNADETAAEAWLRVPKISADGPHALQSDGLMYRSQTEVIDSVDWTTPVFKLTQRLPEEGLAPESLLEYLFGRESLNRKSRRPHSNHCWSATSRRTRHSTHAIYRSRQRNPFGARSG
jgi:hypothetical protein